MERSEVGIGYRVLTTVANFFRALKAGDIKTAESYWNALKMEVEELPAKLEMVEDVDEEVNPLVLEYAKRVLRMEV